MKLPFGTDGPPARLQSPIVGGIDIREVAGCTCLRLRRSSREATQLFDAHLSKAGLTIGQFGLMAQLYGVGIFQESISIKGLSKLFGTDPTTLVRTLKPLELNGWIAGEQDPRDRRSRLVALTKEGRERLAVAMPHWEAAQQELRESVGEASALALNGMLDLVSQKMQLDLSELDV